MNRPTAPYTPPPAPVLPLTAPAPLPAPTPLTADELVRHLGATLGLWTVAGAVFYGAAQAGRLGWLGPWEWLGVGGLAPVVLGLLGAVPLWPVWSAWHAAQLWTATQAAHLAASTDERLILQAAYLAHIDKVYGRAVDVPDPGPDVYHMGRRVTGVYPVDAPASPPAVTRDMGRRVDEALARAGAMVDRAVGRYSPPEDAPAPVDPADTQRLPEYPALPATAYQPPPSPPSPYTGNMRALVTCALQTGTCSGKQARALGISDRQHRRACDALGQLGILRHDEGKEWELVEPLAGRLRRILQDNGEAELHYWVEKHLVN